MLRWCLGSTFTVAVPGRPAGLLVEGRVAVAATACLQVSSRRPSPQRPSGPPLSPGVFLGGRPLGGRSRDFVEAATGARRTWKKTGGDGRSTNRCFTFSGGVAISRPLLNGQPAKLSFSPPCPPWGKRGPLPLPRQPVGSFPASPLEICHLFQFASHGHLKRRRLEASQLSYCGPYVPG